MTNKEAIEIIKVAIAEVEWNYPMDYAIAFSVAKEALEKQIPKKPMHSGIEYDCPSCLEAVGYITQTNRLIKNHHCRCGQRIDWSDIDDE